jgi:nucleotide-binding universal stress UspA family protein
MSTVLAAIDDSAAARPVLAAAQAVAALWRGTVEAIHVGDDGGHTADAAARAAGVTLRLERGDVVAGVTRAAARPDVDAVVIGARGRPGGPRPAGHVAVELITLCDKPVIVVPPEASCAGELHHLLFGLEGTTPTSEVLGRTMELARDQGFEVVVVHVDDEASLPLFSDQPQHETDVFASEFLARYGPTVEPSALQLRIGEPAEQVLSTCDATGADMVVLAWSCSLAPGRAGFVRHILEHARIPVMLVPIGVS